MTVPTRQLAILGSTGSIGSSTLDVVARHPQRYQVYALTANSRDDLLLEQCVQFNPRVAVLGDSTAAERLQSALRARGSGTEVRCGMQALVQVASDPGVDIVMAAIVGGAGLRSSLAAAEAGKTLLLANKESLVMGGALFMQAVARGGATLLPIDSEHNAIFQCLPPEHIAGTRPPGVQRIILTASGGPFRGWTAAQLAAVTPAQACAHPNWAMGQKISVDSATLMNKGLEVIEACWLFGVQADDVDVVIHPQSVIHSMVSYVDGSVLAQLGNPDMKTPIAYGLAWPERMDAGVAPLDLLLAKRLEFQPPDDDVFPGVRLARQAWAMGGTASAVLNAANEETVAAFLRSNIALPDICAINNEVLHAQAPVAATDLGVIEDADAEARQRARWLIERRGADCRK